MKDNIISILSCNRFLTEKEIQKFLPPVSSKKEIQEVLLQLQNEDKVAKYNFSNRNYWINYLEYKSKNIFLVEKLPKSSIWHERVTII